MDLLLTKYLKAGISYRVANVFFRAGQIEARGHPLTGR
jgi:hypothetical protein